ncbi:TonB-dependent receptor [Gluconobacter thailandicus]|uniref:TonB-dependent receptor plug domain-containing protein n=1 Tax=Gluconobacter thailandicus TaxID=257438 RepID=A0AAP9JIH7_GLUTH|nr:TonB-dependent receptor [Gluconobacter thailandicus]QEH96995.1 TonB-dependent receptor plug domain-containing protein [Gluconobacter thailandicus]
MPSHPIACPRNITFYQTDSARRDVLVSDRKKGLITATFLSGLLLSVTANASDKKHANQTKHAEKMARQEKARAEEAINVRGSHRQAPGGGMMRVETAARSIQTVTQDYIATQSPTASPLDLIRNLPSVNITTYDPSGNEGSFISSRGLYDNDIGLLINGMPVANGATASASMFIQYYIDTNNISSESMTPGSISVEDPLTSAAGGALSITTRAPAQKFGGTISGSYGTFNSFRQFLRVDSGEIGHSGVTSYLSLSHTRSDAWRGSGNSDRKHLDFQIRKTIGERSSVDFFLGYNHSHYYANRYPTMANFQNDKHGRPVTTPLNYTADFDAASPANYYGVRGTDRDQFYASLPMKFALNNIFSLNFVPYYQRAEITQNSASRLQETRTYSGTQSLPIDLNGDGVISSATRSAVSSNAISLNQQGGIVASLHWSWHNNEGQIGYWHEDNSYLLRTPMSQMNQITGATPADTDVSSYYRTRRGDIYYSTNYLGSYHLNSGFIEDTAYFLNRKMSVTAGLKVVAMTLTGQDYLPSTASKSSTTMVSPTPRFSWSYNFNPRHQLYINAEGDFRAISPANLISRYSTSTGNMTTSGAGVKPQYSIKEELGYRYTGNIFIADLAVFNVNVSNRLLSLNTFSNDVQVSQTVNAGGETIRGVDIMLSTRLLYNRFRPYVSFEYLHATMDNNLSAITTSGGIDCLRTKGKTPIITPTIMGSVGLTYEEGPFFMNASLHYTGKQYSTFMNDQALPHYFTNSLTFGYHFPKFFIAKSPTFKLNFANLTGQNKLGGVYGFSNNARATTGVYGNAISADSTPTYTPSPSFNMMGTISTSF